jgi:hypothetical protein
MSLLKQLDNVADKVAYQKYSLQFGIETIDLMVPLKNAKMFEAEINKASIQNKKQLLDVIDSYNGEVKK